MNATSLGDRWRTEAGQPLAEEVIARLIAGRDLAGLGLGNHEGRVDLRGLHAPLPRRLQRFETQGWFVEQLGESLNFQGVRLDGLDFSGAQLQSFRFHNSKIIECRFDDTNCRDWRLWNCEIVDSSFAGGSLHEAAVGTWHDGQRNTWRRIDFSGSDFRVGLSREAVYEDCDFSHAKLTKVEFSQCTLRRCRFSGELHEVVFDGRELSDRPAPLPMENVDFAGAEFDRVEFMGFSLEGVSLPSDPYIRAVERYRCVVEHALMALERNDSLPARMLRGELQNRLRMMRSVDETNVFNRRDYVLSGGEELAALADEVFSRAEDECSGK